MTRTLDTTHPSPPPLGPTDRPSPPSLQRAGSGRRRLVAVVLTGTVLLVAVNAGVWLWLWPDAAATAGDHTIDFDDAVELEHGMRPLVSDRVGEIGDIESVRVRRTSDPVPATVRVYARSADERPALLVEAHEQPGQVSPDRELADGRHYEALVVDGPYVSLAMLGPARQYLRVMGRAMAFDDLVGIVERAEFGELGFARPPEGWVEVGVVPMPPWLDGFIARYDLTDGRWLAISVEPATPGREMLAAFGPHDPIDLGTDGWAFRQRPAGESVLFERGDVVVQLMGAFTEAEFALVAGSLREMQPGEHPVLEPEW